MAVNLSYDDLIEVLNDDDHVEHEIYVRFMHIIDFDSFRFS